MKRVLFAALVITALLLSLVGTVAAAPPADNPGKGPPELERIDFIHYAKDFAPGKPEGTPGKGPGGGNGDEDPIDYYKLSKLILTETAEYYVNPSGSGIAIASDVVDAVSSGFEAWDAVTSTELFSDTVEITSDAGRVRNYSNIISWGALKEGIVAVATMWYIPGKPPREIVEFDVVFNTFYAWGIDPDGELDGYILEDAFDVRNIVTHEAGHVVGLDDLYDKTYSELTMYGYSEEGETKKTSLENGDKLGCQYLYGE